MSLKLVRFGTYLGGMTTLPVLERTHEVGSGESRMVFVDIPDGQADLLGTERARRAPMSIAYNCRIYDTTTAGLETQLDALRALRGKRDKLWLETQSGALRWAYARLDNVTGSNIQQFPLYIPLVITFAILSPAWNGSQHGWSFDDGYYFDEGLFFDAGLVYSLTTTPITLSVTNGGNVEVENSVIRVIAITSSITNIVIKRKVEGVTVEHMVYSGTILADKELTIDCGAQSVTNDGTDDYAHFSRGADHKYDGWMKLEPGANSIEVTRTGGGATSTIEFVFNDAYA